MASPVTDTTMWEDKTLEAMWKLVEERVLELSRKEKHTLTKDMTIEDVMGCLDTAQKTDEKSAEKHAWIRKTFNRTLDCIQTFGGIFSNVASNASFLRSLIITLTTDVYS